jgi:purine-binding chemotaxis protein CheW
MRFLLAEVGACLCAVPLEFIAETMRSLPFEPLASMPSFVLGVSLIRGRASPVLDAGLLLGSAKTHASRFIALKLGDRSAALAVDSVVGVRSLPESAELEMSPLLSDAAVGSLATFDSKLLTVLRATSLVPDRLWKALEKVA